MTPNEFKELIEKEQECPESLPRVLQALWYDKKGNWNTAHEIVQNASDADSAWIHAYLHRKEGDLSNADYWYHRSGQSEFKGTLDQEWEQIASVLLVKDSN
ncbi:hypothetical protein G7B40_028910 [Aetokthonos hydrillicola Thurmond2011]|jgi:hypothetical protein|uniref:Uncharacterized protein n=1 Tax=Aetokthonos hydrillicola Thurmond2011 TaxID=2712845 RepID=A0AAP5MBY9_9CYAN|nr:hypothetical protein [Aetokthonos hydrillicola]MBO3463879.1 hypothetical protein [Aetokthonos hydrillicola CCALA 1050]MBW4584244.1 hypothetical protein [Aetokthonos hydrillicola CCALA 1050]MDR9898547.1 hypothetical protein [Aetokthonos hydrillicola Thurmond2011]